MSPKSAELPFGGRDLTALAPTAYRRRERELSEVRAVILHQTGFGTWALDNPLWPKVRAHFVVHRCGLISQNHEITTRMTTGSGVANRWAITVECEGNYPLRYLDGKARYWAPSKYGRDRLDDAPRQVIAARALLAHLATVVPGLGVGAHRHISAKKSGCCGPDLWREVGQWAVDNLHMPEIKPLDSGLAVPSDWRGTPRIAIEPAAPLAA